MGEDSLSLAPEYILDGKWRTMVDESTLNFTVTLHGTTQTRCIILPKATGNALITINNISWQFFRSFTIVSHQSCPESTARFIQHIERKQDLTPTNQNTRSSTRRHSISRILVPHHDHDHNKHSRRLKPPNHQIFTVLDPFDPLHFAFPFGLPAVPYCRGGTQCLKMDFSHNTSTKYLKQGAHIITCNHNNDTEGSVQTLTVFSPTLLPLNPFQSFVLHGTWAGGTTQSNNSDLYPRRSMFGGLKPPTNKHPAAYHTRTPFSPQSRRCIVAQHSKARP